MMKFQQLDAKNKEKEEKIKQREEERLRKQKELKEMKKYEQMQADQRRKTVVKET